MIRPQRPRDLVEREFQNLESPRLVGSVRPEGGSQGPGGGSQGPGGWVTGTHKEERRITRKTDYEEVRAISLHELAATERQISLIRDLVILSGEPAPDADDLHTLSISDAGNRIRALYADIGRHALYAGPWAGEPAWELLTPTGKRWADAAMVPQEVIPA